MKKRLDFFDARTTAIPDSPINSKGQMLQTPSSKNPPCQDQACRLPVGDTPDKLSALHFRSLWFMESFDLQEWTRIGPINRCSPQSRSAGWQPAVSLTGSRLAWSWHEIERRFIEKVKVRRAFAHVLALVSSASLMLLLAITGCSKSASDTKPAADAGDKDKAAAEPKAGVTLDTETQERIALKIETPAPAQWQPELKAHGQVLDPSPLMDLAMELDRTEITLDSSQQELARAKQLKEGSNISGRAYQDAETAYSQNLAAAQAVRFKIQTGWGRKIAETLGPIELSPGVERKPDKFLEELRDAKVLVRVDLPPGARLENQSQTARIVSLADNATPVAATCFDLLPVLDTQTQQQGILFIADQPASGRLTPGEAVTALVRTSGEPLSGVIVPPAAILRHEGAGWVYVQTETNQFVRTAIPLDRFTDGGWFVSENLSATNRIIVSGAQTVLSAELSGGGFNTGSRD